MFPCYVGCAQEVIQTAGREKIRIKVTLNCMICGVLVQFILNVINRKHLDSRLQMRDALIAKLIFHQLRMEKATINLNDTNQEVSTEHML